MIAKRPDTPDNADRRSRHRVTVILGVSRAIARKRFHCPACGTFVFEYWDDLKVLVPGHPERSAGIMVPCHGTVTETNPILNTVERYRCKANYFIT